MATPGQNLGPIWHDRSGELSSASARAISVWPKSIGCELRVSFMVTASAQRTLRAGLNRQGIDPPQQMASSVGRLIRSVAQLAPGEALSRLSSVAIVMFLGHAYGVVILGVYALAVSISQYLQPIIDFGLRHIGARLVACLLYTSRCV